jgi:hypothetical protein
MMSAKWTAALGALVAGTASMVAQGAAQPVYQRGYDLNVSGAILTETTLNTANVGPSSFGLLYKLSLDSNAFAQPLYVPNVVIPGLGTHNVLYVATMNDSIYAFDADVGGAPLWSVNLASFLSTTAVAWANFNFPPVSNAGNLGILSTPVIDPLTHIMYVVACTLENGTMAYRLHGVDITDGSEPYGPGVLIAANRAGATFDARYLTQRSSLVLADNQVIVAFGGMQSETGQPYTGWVMSYDELTLQQSGSFNTVTANTGGGVWHSGRPPAVDAAGDVYVFDGNAQGSAGYDGSTSFSESVVKLDPSQGLALIDWFTPSNWSYLDVHDLDLSGSGPMLIPGTTLLAGGGKSGVLYLIDITNLGKFVANDAQIVQEQSITSRIASGPVFWNRAPANGGPLMYNWGFNDVLKTYPFSSVFASSPSSVGTATMAYPGPVLALSANADQHGSGLLWATTQDPTTKNGVLHAYDAENITTELWNSEMMLSRDGYGQFATYVPPLIANGKVYQASFFPGAIDAYGLLPYTLQPMSLGFGTWQTNTSSPAQLVTVTNIGAAALPIGSITISGANAGAFSQTNTCAGSVAIGGTCTIRVVFKSTTSGSSAATLNVIGAGGTGTQMVALSGSAVAPSYTVSPAALAFGTVTTNTTSMPQSVTVTNASSAALPISSIALAGTNRALFSQTNTCGSSVPGGSACTVNVTFAPTSGGSKVASVNVSAGGGAGTQTVTLSGTGAAPGYTLAPSTLAFGSIAKNTASAPLLVTLTNGGSTALPITSITLVGTNRALFSQTNTCGSSVPAATACSIYVVFAPTSSGSKTATLDVNAGGGAGTQTVALSGTGTTSAYTLSPTALAFGSIAKNSVSAPLSLTVTNGGSAALPITSITLAGTNRSQFVQTNTCGSSVSGNSNCTINVQFAPTSTGSKAATLNVTAAGSTQKSTLGGTGL